MSRKKTRRARNLCFRITRVLRWWKLPISILSMEGRFIFRLRILSGQNKSSTRLKRPTRRHVGSTGLACTRKRKLLHPTHS